MEKSDKVARVRRYSAAGRWQTCWVRITMADSGPGQLASDRGNESDDDCPNGQQQCTRDLTSAQRAHRASEAMHFERANLRRTKRALEGASWFYSAADDEFGGSRRERRESVWRNGRGFGGDSVGIVLVALVVIISIESAFASVSLVARVEHVHQSERHHRTPPSAALNRTSACGKQRRQVNDDGGARCDHGPATNLQSASSGEISETSQDNDDNGPPEERISRRTKRSNYDSTTAALADNNDNNNGGGRRVCNDCLAIPLVALVGGRQINGFILQPTPANLQARLRAPPKNEPASSDCEQQQQQSSRRVRSDFAHGNNQQRHLQTNEPIGTSSAAGDSSRYGTTQTSAAAYDKLQPRNQPETYYQPPRAGPTANPFEPKSDDKCPMVGHVTVCDQIGSYPAEAILQKLHNLELALYKSHFDIDSLFSDESDNLSDPFEILAPAAEPVDQMANMMGPSEPNYANRTQINAETYLAYERGPTDGAVKSSGVGVESRSPETGEESSSGRPAKEENFTRSQWPHSRFESNSKAFSKVDRREANVLRLGGSEPSGGSRFDDGLARGESIASPARDWGQGPVVHNWPEPKQRPKQAALVDKMFDLVEQNGDAVGGTNSIHNVQPTKLPIERPGVRVSGAHKAGASVKGEEKSGGNTERGGDTRDDRNGPSGHEPKLATTTTTTLASESSVKSGGHQLGPSVPLASPTTNFVQTHKLSQRLNMERARTNALGSAEAVERRPLSSDIAAGRDQRNVGHGSVNDGRGGVGAPDGYQTAAPKQASAELDSELARNNQEQRSPVGGGGAKSLRQRNGAASGSGSGSGTQSSGSLSQSSLATRSRGGGGSAAAASKVLTQEGGTNSSQPVRSRGAGRQLNLLSPKPATLLLSSALSSVHDNIDQIGRKSPPTQYQRNSQPLESDGPQPAGGRFVTKKATWASEPNKLVRALTKIETTLGADAGFQVRKTSNGSERPRRQVADLASEQDNGDADGRERVGTVEQPSPSTSDDSEAQSAGPQPICRARSIYISPRAAMNDKKQWKYVVNAPERDRRIKQIIRVDICEAPFEPCSGDLTIPLGFISQCKQKYAKKKLLALGSQSGLLEVDTFFIPSCCVCQLVPDRLTGGGGPMSAVDKKS